MWAPTSEPFSSTVTADLAAGLLGELAQAYRGGEPGGARAHDHYVELHRFPAHARSRLSRKKPGTQARPAAGHRMGIADASWVPTPGVELCGTMSTMRFLAMVALAVVISACERESGWSGLSRHPCRGGRRAADHRALVSDRLEATGTNGHRPVHNGREPGSARRRRALRPRPAIARDRRRPPQSPRHSDPPGRGRLHRGGAGTRRRQLARRPDTAAQRRTGAGARAN